MKVNGDIKEILILLDYVNKEEQFNVFYEGKIKMDLLRWVLSMWGIRSIFIELENDKR